MLERVGLGLGVRVIEVLDYRGFAAAINLHLNVAHAHVYVQ